VVRRADPLDQCRHDAGKRWRCARASHRWAMGLMQIMPNAWAGSRSRHGLGVDPFDARDNILAGVAYLGEMHDRYGPSGFPAAYNAGPKRYEEYLATGRALPTETQLYVTIPAPMIGGTPVEGTLAIDPLAGSSAICRAWFSQFDGGIVFTISANRSRYSGPLPCRRACTAAPGRGIVCRPSKRRAVAIMRRVGNSASSASATKPPVRRGRQGRPIHGLRPVIGVHRVVQGKANRPVRLLLAS
jgi:hypothetical protein